MLRHVPARKRQGVILLIVMAMLAIFAVVGLTFVFYADSEANIARTARQAEGLYAPEAEPELLLNHFLAQLNYDTDNEYSALRGHSFARTSFSEDPARSGKNGVPFNGAGALYYLHTQGQFTGLENTKLLNFQRYDWPGHPEVRHPEYYGTGKTRFVGGGNVPWTYPDHNNCFLAAVNANGEVLLQSFHRPWISGPLEDVANPNLTSPHGKYLMFRPRPADHPGFPYPEDGGGDLRNLPWGPGVKKPGGGYWGNDSYWMYTGYPVLVSPSGKKYTVLFAPLIIDLDNRINLTMAGNLSNSAGDSHVSNQGWGRWEVNPTLAGIAPAEFVQFIRSARYGPNNTPDYPLTTTGLPIPFYSKYDWDGDAAGPYLLPLAGSFSIFRTFPAGWDSGVINPPIDEWARNGAKYSYWFPQPALQGDDRPRLHPSHMEALLRAGDKGSPALTSDLFKLMPASMSNARTRALCTVLSHDLNRPGMVPFARAAASYQYNAVKGYAEAPNAAYPDPATPPGGEFINFNSSLALRKRVDLNKKLLDYPALDANGDFTGDPTPAVLERQKLAREIFNMFIAVTGAQDPNLVAVTKPSPEYDASRWLAQLAVNIVDYLDPDDILTPFNWDTKEPAEILFGTEQPRLVLNEAYVQCDTDPLDPGLALVPPVSTFQRMSCWVELHNPLPPTPGTDAYPLDGGNARLRSTQPVYRLVLSKPDPNLRAPNNLTGKADPTKLYKTLAKTDCIVSDWPDPATEPVKTVVLAVPDADRFQDGTLSNKGFFVVGPKQAGDVAKHYLAGRDPALPATHTSPGLVAMVDPLDTALQPTILLQRLACPHRPLNDNPADPAYNPYVTVDYISNVRVNNMLTYNPGLIDPPPALTTGVAEGRRQPYAAAKLELQNPATPPPASPKHTFYRQNCLEMAAPVTFGAAGQTLDVPDWLPQFDRPLMNPMDLLHISGFRPHELTQQFITYPGGIRAKFQHYAPWEKPESLLHRFLEMVDHRDFMLGAPAPGRTPGKINLNTVWDIETFRALCDANPRVSFTPADVDAIWAQVVKSRTNPLGMPSGTDKPFHPFATGYFPPRGPGGFSPYEFQTGLGSTLLREDPDDPTRRLFEVPRVPPTPDTHPYKKWELLSKILQNTTTRSNTFAVWVTAGFFEVTDDTSHPPKLGREIGKDDNRHIRHKFFALVDRTAMQVRPMHTASGTEIRITIDKDYNPPPGGVDKVTFTFNPPRGDLIFDTMTGAKWTIDVGTLLTVGPELPNEEVAPVSAVIPTAGNFGFEILITKPHKQGEEVICRAWHAPWINYDVRKDTKVVPYFTVVD